ncbi:MAG: HigA family addiction module antitoxin [Tepidiformaceae bacterium]
MTSRSSTTIDRPRAEEDQITPGEVLLEEFLRPLGISQYRLAQRVSVPPRRINEIVHGTRAITADTALRFARYFDTTPQFWLNLQMFYDLRRTQAALGRRLDHEVTPMGEAG